MRKIHLIVCILVLSCFAGCAYFQERIDNASQCLQDPACKADVQAKTDLVKAVAGASGIPAASAVAGSVVTALLLFFAKPKKKE